ncbi:LiaF transmembrane domain-containing protein [Microbacter margulisiae]|uniref:Putative membrane protein n=1 Tax=Microbacter margulisiae TaxID=1350067 RepID=A0A7W5DT23_9PORP|nr:DUF5668 domain-containing protein [Microbacter margulisiae]MBB3188250.1 putative membrane protein [Microbacter margulisiae]
MEKLHERHHHNNGPAFAIVLIIVGALFLGFNVGIIPDRFHPVLISWEMLLIVLGTVSLLRRHFVGGVVLLLIGGFFILPKLLAISGNFVQMYWPVLLIFLGIVLLLSRLTHKNHVTISRSYDWQEIKQEAIYKEGSVRNGIHKNVAFANEEFVVLDSEFAGGSVNVTFGEMKIDLRKTALASSKVMFEINVSFGNIIIFVPADWQVQLQVNTVFGGFEDKRIFPSERNGNQDKTLVIFGSTSFGGGELRN